LVSNLAAERQPGSLSGQRWAASPIPRHPRRLKR
jgi:hypothetical protein